MSQQVVEPRHIFEACVTPHGTLSRRRLMQIAGVDLFGLSLGGWLLPESLWAADPTKSGMLEPLNRFPQMVQEYFVERVRQAERDASKVRSAIKTKADAERYVENVRERIRVCFGPFPEKTPLEPRITGVIERDAYKIEKVIFQSRPEFLVTANLYVPKGRKFPLPGVVGSCGHSPNGKADDEYQAFAQGLVRSGYVVLIFDPISQGERLQYTDAHLQSRIGACVAEHLYEGNQQFLVGEFFGAWRAWDGIRALDYLLSREEVDPHRVGVTGCSGGGTMTTWLCGVEQRWTVAAPSCFVTTFRHNMENELPGDTEQCPPKALALGLDHSDFLAALAPKPIIILAKERDFFDVRGSAQAFSRLKRLYALLDAEENVALFVGPTHHGYSKEHREAMYGWFNRATGISQAISEPEITSETDETLWCTPHGQVAELKSRPIYSLTKATSQELDQRRQKLSSGKLLQAVTEVLRLPLRQNNIEYRILRPMSGRKYPKKYSVTYAVETELGISALVHLLLDEAHYSRPPRGYPRAVLYVAHHSSDAELREEPWLAELFKAEPHSALFACDVRGIGDSRPNTCGRDAFLKPYGSDYFYAIHAIMLDSPYVGQKTFDLLCVLDWLKACGHREVHLAAKGWGAIPATFAAMLSPMVVQVTLKNALTSYAEAAQSENYGWPLSCFLPNVLARFDLPDCYQALASKKLRQIEAWEANPKR